MLSRRSGGRIASSETKRRKNLSFGDESGTAEDVVAFGKDAAVSENPKLRINISSDVSAAGLGRTGGGSANSGDVVGFTDSVIDGGGMEFCSLVRTGGPGWLTDSTFFSGSDFEIGGSDVELAESPLHHFEMASNNETELFVSFFKSSRSFCV